MGFKIEEKKCIGCGLCQTICPECFVVKNGLAKVINFELKNCCNFKEVVENCPCKAIKFENKN